jgi:hypothetical protein
MPYKDKFYQKRLPGKRNFAILENFFDGFSDLKNTFQARPGLTFSANVRLFIEQRDKLFPIAFPWAGVRATSALSFFSISYLWAGWFRNRLVGPTCRAVSCTARQDIVNYIGKQDSATVWDTDTSGLPRHTASGSSRSPELPCLLAE